MASAIAMIMAACSCSIVVLILAARRLSFAAPPAPAKAERACVRTNRSSRAAVGDRRLGAGGLLHPQLHGDDRAPCVVNSFGTRWFNTWLPAGFTTHWYSSGLGRIPAARRPDRDLRGGRRGGAALRAARRAGGLRDGAAEFSRQAARHAAVPVAAAGAADHLRHSAGDGAVPGASRRQHVRRHPRQPGADRALRDPGHDPVHRADRPARGGGGARVRRRHRAAVHPYPGAAAGAGHPGGAAAGAGAHHRHVRTDLPHRRPDSQTLVVALYYAVFAAGVRAGQSIDAMAVVYMMTTLVWLLIALRFVNPTQIVTRAKREATQL